MTKILDFGIEEHASARRYGDCFWLIGLPDGREISAWADEMHVLPSGALELRTTKRSAEGEEKRGEPLTTVLLPAGSWVHAYAASIVDGSPVAVEYLAKPAAARLDGQPGRQR
jgi:hypothetical protein